jgi:hypothetical protein
MCCHFPLGDRADAVTTIGGSEALQRGRADPSPACRSTSGNGDGFLQSPKDNPPRSHRHCLSGRLALSLRRMPMSLQHGFSTKGFIGDQQSGIRLFHRRLHGLQR